MCQWGVCKVLFRKWVKSSRPINLLHPELDQGLVSVHITETSIPGAEQPRGAFMNNWCCSEWVETFCFACGYYEFSLTFKNSGQVKLQNTCVTVLDAVCLHSVDAHSVHSMLISGAVASPNPATAKLLPEMGVLWECCIFSLHIPLKVYLILYLFLFALFLCLV